MVDEYFIGKKFLRMYMNKEIVLGKFPLEQRFKELHKHQLQKYENWKNSMIASSLVIFLINAPTCNVFESFLVLVTCGFLSFTYCYPSNEYYKVASSLYNKYKPMSEHGLRYKYDLTDEERNEMIGKIFK